jgi:hypothetical protein
LYARNTGLIYQMDSDDAGALAEQGEREAEAEEEGEQSPRRIKKKKGNNKNDPFEGMTKAERQVKVKLENKERRSTKMPKKVKMKMIKKTTSKKHETH